MAQPLQHRRICPPRRNPDFFMDMNNGLQQSKKLNKLNSEFLKICHQKIRSLRRKTQELLSHVYSDLPHVICLSELHLKASELSFVNIESYTIKAHFLGHYMKVEE